MISNLHLVVELGTWVPQNGAPEALSKLEAYLAGRPGIILTLVTRGSLPAALEKVARSGQILPHHLIAEAGTSLFHRQESGAWIEDADYRVWAEAHWNVSALERFVQWGLPVWARRTLGGYSSRHLIFDLPEEGNASRSVTELKASLENNGLKGIVVQIGQAVEVVPQGVDRGTAVTFLHRNLASPGPLMVCGSTDLNLSLFQRADYPVLMADSSLDFETPGIPRKQIYRTSTGGPAGVQEILIQIEFESLQCGKRN